MRSTKAIVVLLVLALCAVAIVPFACVLLISIGMYHDTQRVQEIETQMQLPENYQTAGRDLALYCQSLDVIGDPPDDSLHMWLPPSVRKFGATYVELTPEAARVEMGGGFHHWGYVLERDKDASTAESNLWRLRIYGEHFGERALTTFSLSSAEQISRKQFVANAIANYDREAASAKEPAVWHQRKIALFLRHDMRVEARNACRQMLQQLPDNWWANLTLALIDAKHDVQRSETRLRRWVEAAPSCARYLCLAHYYRLEGRAGDASMAVGKAISLPVRDDDPAEEGYVELRATGMAIYLCDSKQYTMVIRLCDAVTPILEKGDQTRDALYTLRAAAMSAQGGNAGPLAPAVRQDKDFDPYYMQGDETQIDIEKLRGSDDGAHQERP